MKKKTPTLVLVCALALVAIAASGLYMNSSPAGMKTVEFDVAPGSTQRACAVKLKKANLIRNERFLLAISRIRGEKPLKSGSYMIYSGMSSYEVLHAITGRPSATVQVVIPEGFSLRQIAARLDEKKITSGSDLIDFASDKKLLDYLGIAGPSAEGYLFPDTYAFPRGSDPRDVIRMMHAHMKKKLAGVEGAGSLGAKELHELLTMASLVEGEARVPAERPYVSSVFHNRLKRDIKLECDPTVRYAVGNFDRPITRKQLQTDHPYNTYMRKGLPPGPICSPGIESIRAALAPKESEFIYFVARNDGSHYFSKTKAEHERAVDHYQRKKGGEFKDEQKLR